MSKGCGNHFFKTMFTKSNLNESANKSLWQATTTLLVALIVAVSLTGCNYLKQLTSSTSTPSQTTNPGQTAQPGRPETKGGGMDGYWKLAFSFNDDVKSSHVRIKQEGDKFSGEGTDDHNSKPFLIENGVIRQNEVIFYKRYEQPDNPGQPPVEYSGTLDVPKSTYMSGKYLISFQGKEVSGDWEAQREGAEVDAAPADTPPQQQAPPANNMAAPTGAPDLSGKWNAGYEYQFKTIHSVMFLEQINDKITGHGVDTNTNEKFQIEKGWYNYPKVTLIRKYPPLKSKGGTKPEHKMTFKADVSWVNDADYTGPYMQGKTDGGGAWEAQKVMR